MSSEKVQKISKEELRYARTLSDILHLHRWAGGDQVDLATIFGLANGIESVIRETLPEENGISSETQDKIEDILVDVDKGKESTDSLFLKQRFHREGISDTDAITIMQLCILQGRFTGVIKKISEAGGAYSTVFMGKTKSSEWDGAKIYMELVLETGKDRLEIISTFAPCLPRVGETIDLSYLFDKKAGEMRMEVVGIGYDAHRMKDPLDKHPMAQLIPHVFLVPCESEDDQH